MESFARIYCSGIVFLSAVVLRAMSTEGRSSAVHWHSRVDFVAGPPSTCALWLCSVPHIISDQHSQCTAGWECWSTLGWACRDMDPTSHSPVGMEGASNALFLKHYRPQHQAEHKGIDHLRGIRHPCNPSAWMPEEKESLAPGGISGQRGAACPPEQQRPAGPCKGCRLGTKRSLSCSEVRHKNLLPVVIPGI